MKKITLMFSLFVSILTNAQQIISTNTTWSGNVFLSQKVIVNEGATLKIEAGTKVQIAYLDANGDNIGDVEIEINGEIQIDGILGCSSVIFSPVTSTVDKKYWNGLTINSKKQNSISGVEIYNANRALTIKSNVIINSTLINNFYDVGIYLSPTVKSSTVKLNSITLKNGGTGIHSEIDSSNIYLNSSLIDSCVNGVINSFSNFKMSNSKISNCSRIAVSTEDGKMDINNCMINDNYSFGIINSSSDLKVSKTTIKDNYLGGIIIAGFAKNYVQNSSVINNIGSQFEITDYKFNIAKGSTFAVFEGSPFIKVNNNNIYGDTLKIAVDSLNLFPLLLSDVTADLYGISIQSPQSRNILRFTPVTGRLHSFNTDVQVRYGNALDKEPLRVLITWKNDLEDICTKTVMLKGSYSAGGTSVGDMALNNYYHLNKLFYLNIKPAGYVSLYGFPRNIKYQYSFGGKYISTNIWQTDSIYDFSNNNFNTYFPLKHFYDYSKKTINYSGYSISTISNSIVNDQLLIKSNQSALGTTNDSDTLCPSFKLIAPSIAGATYNWYLNGNLFTSSSVNEYIPIVSGLWHSVINSGSCNLQTVARNIVLSSGPSLSVTGVKTLCAGQSTTISVKGADSYVWNTNQTSSSLILSPTTSTTYSVTGYKNGCTTTENVNIIVNPLPIVSLNPYPSVVLCKGTTTKLTSSDASSYLWSTGAITKSIDVTSEGVYSVKVTDLNGCSSTSQNTTVVYSNSTISTPTISLNKSNSICKGDSVVLTSSDASNYKWSTGEITKSIIVKNSGSYIVTITNGNCTSTSLNSTIVVNQLPQNPLLTITGQSKFCSGDSAILTVSNISNASTYKWQNGISGTKFKVLSSGDYSVQVTDNNGCISNSEIKSFNVQTVSPIDIYTDGNLLVGNEYSFCIGKTLTLKAENITNLSWDNGVVDNVSFSPTVSKKYTVSGYDINGCFNKRTFLLNTNASLENNPISIYANSTLVNTDYTICQGDPIVLTTQNLTSPIWSNQVQENLAFKPSVSGNYTVTGNDLSGCEKSATIKINVNTLPLVSVKNTVTSVCQGDSIQLFGQGANNYIWDNSVVDGEHIKVFASKTYKVIGTDENGCSNSASITINAKTVTPIKANASNLNSCSGEAITVFGTGSSNYIWNNNVIDASPFVPTESKMYVVTSKGTSGCNASDSIFISVGSKPNVYIESSTTKICQGYGTTRLNAYGAVSYVWDNNVKDGQDFTLLKTTKYTVIGTNELGCNDTAVITIEVAPLPNVTITQNPINICPGNNVTLTATGGTIYSWNLTGNPNLNISNGVQFTPIAGKYEVTVYNSDGCQTTKSIDLVINKNPTISILKSTTNNLCSGDQFSLTASGASNYIWDNNVKNGVPFSVSTITKYTVTATDINNCTTIQSVNLVINPKPVIYIINNTTNNLCSGDQLTLTASGASNYSWNNNVKNGVPFSVTTSSKYTVTSTDAKGCSASAFIDITVRALPTKPVITSTNSSLSTTTYNGYQWYLNNQLMSSQTNQNLNITDNGSYSVVVNDTYGCKNKSDDFVVKSLSLYELRNNRLLVYPNPSTGIFTINSSINSSINLYDIYGTHIAEYTENTTQIDLSNYANGVYFLKTQQSNKEEVVKLILNK